MKRREFLKYLSLSGSSALLGGCSLLHKSGLCPSCINPFAPPAPAQQSAGIEDLAPSTTPSQKLDEQILRSLLKDERAKSLYFSQDFPDDLFFDSIKTNVMKVLVTKFRAIQRYAGHGNFNLLGMNEAFLFAQRAPGCAGGFNNKEKAFLEELFYFDAVKYGFMGDKVATNFTDEINSKEVHKIPGSGHFLRKGDSLDLFNKVKNDVGENLILTSGVRGVAKQFHLFMEKGLSVGGNMSKASRSLAPPGYSFHFKGDFDVGRRNFGLRNFEESFARTDEFKRLVDLGYVNIRYTQSNDLGVRFEPWHLKV